MAITFPIPVFQGLNITEKVIKIGGKGYITKGLGFALGKLKFSHTSVKKMTVRK